MARMSLTNNKKRDVPILKPEALLRQLDKLGYFQSAVFSLRPSMSVPGKFKI